MKMKSLYSMLLVLLIFTNYSYSQNLPLVNQIKLPINKITNINISYDDEDITFYNSDKSELVVKEYMSKDNKSFYANVKLTENSIHITEGDKPVSKKAFNRQIEIYLPSTYTNSLTVSTTNGNINLQNSSLLLETLHVNSTSGNININKVNASKIILTTTSGTINCNEIIGYVDYKGTHGNLFVKSAKGSGSYKAENSGILNVNYLEVIDNLFFSNKNNDINLTLPKNLIFTFEATTKNGIISTSFQENLVIDNKTLKGNIGHNPSLIIKLESNNGNIFVSNK